MHLQVTAESVGRGLGGKITDNVNTVPALQQINFFLTHSIVTQHGCHLLHCKLSQIVFCSRDFLNFRIERAILSHRFAWLRVGLAEEAEAFS